MGGVGRREADGGRGRGGARGRDMRMLACACMHGACRCVCTCGGMHNTKRHPPPPTDTHRYTHTHTPTHIHTHTHTHTHAHTHRLYRAPALAAPSARVHIWRRAAAGPAPPPPACRWAPGDSSCRTCGRAAAGRAAGQTPGWVGEGRRGVACPSPAKQVSIGVGGLRRGLGFGGLHCMRVWVPRPHKKREPHTEGSELWDRKVTPD